MYRSDICPVSFRSTVYECIISRTGSNWILSLSNSLYKKGLSLEELADLLVDLGAVYAINMDGGGSSTIVMPSVVANLNATKDDYATTTATANATVTTGHRKNYAVINRPTCLDIPFPHCQRAVSTVLCVSTNATES